jgi:hypothetical protein
VACGEGEEMKLRRTNDLRSSIAIVSFKDKHFFLSNFFTCRIKWQGKEYKSVEHLFQASKATCERDHELIRNAPTPKDAKKWGSGIQCRADWEEIKIEVMRGALLMKFADDKLAGRLLDTRNAPLVEGNFWHDNFWGKCWCVECIESGRHDRAYNVLGLLLMEIRAMMGRGRKGA